MIGLAIVFVLSAAAQSAAAPVTVTKIAAPARALRFEVIVPAPREAGSRARNGMPPMTGLAGGNATLLARSMG